MEDLLETYRDKAVTSSEFRQRNNHKHSTTNSKENNDDSYSPSDCHYALENSFD